MIAKWRMGALVLLATAAFTFPRAFAAPSHYDGEWSVLVVTDHGDCDRGYRYSVRVQNGRVHYDGEAGIDISGQVTNDGRVNVTIARGDQRASGTGKLSAAQGSGRWSGRSSANACNGHWVAEKRSDTVGQRARD
jgi:hypothetical protein